MKRKRFTEEQIAFALRQVEGDVPVKEVCRKLQISEQTFYRWKKKFGGLGVAEVRRLKHLVGRPVQRVMCRGARAPEMSGRRGGEGRTL